MAFRVSKSRTFTVPVQVGDEDFTATFHALPDVALKEFDAPGVEMQKEFLRRVIVRLEGLVDDHDQPLGFSSTLFEELIDYSDLRWAMLGAYHTGFYRAKAGN
ncbi:MULTISPECIES: hypothetical protein [Salipiger]|uniref:Uncharacterized protein n=1 Tax=Salipiger profundus TaxID=1229727 RepID=A0A1U7CZK3_9RHOB|nr:MULTISPECIES: hypothetical protein [Salipiger]ALF02049.1 hypothetical protein vBThpSP1_010 [Thiobacimonas phage vB_ThpS-P1]APX21273.1 hypothetical protein Ga0080559_TMP477 [Salipiger profundus]GGA03658.1 hypothetical protein GCM10011326_13800 [Salipiger profundus]